MSDIPRKVPARVRSLDFPAELDDVFAGSRIVGVARGAQSVTITLADGRKVTYELELSAGGGGFWVLQS